MAKKYVTPETMGLARTLMIDHVVGTHTELLITWGPFTGLQISGKDLDIFLDAKICSEMMLQFESLAQRAAKVFEEGGVVDVPEEA